MIQQSKRITLLQEREFKATEISDTKCNAFVDDEGQLQVAFDMVMDSGAVIRESIAFNRYETQKVRAVLNKA